MILMQNRNKLHNSINIIDILKVMLFSLSLSLVTLTCQLCHHGYGLNLAKSLYVYIYF